uniref:Uncharacterized protein n=1 Tax=Glossina austeni TaxID=7395 RepID=A0A1A9VF63_GLOAU
MVSTGVIIFVAVFHVLLRLALFIEPNTAYCFTDPTLASWIFVIGVLEILWSICVYPIRFMQLPAALQIIIEILVALLLTEFGATVVWCHVDNLSCYLTKSLLLAMGMHPKTYAAYEDYILGTATTLVGVAFLIGVVKNTHHLDSMRDNGKHLICKLQNSIMALTKAPTVKEINNESRKPNRRRKLREEAISDDEEFVGFINSLSFIFHPLASRKNTKDMLAVPITMRGGNHMSSFRVC